MSHCKKLVTTAVFLVFFLLVPQNGGALTPVFYRQNEYERLGRVVDSEKFGKTMLEINGYLQFPVKIIPDPEVRQAWPLRSPYTNTACAAYYAESYDEAKGQVGHLGQSESAAARIWAKYEDKLIELPTEDLPEEIFFHLKTSYGDADGNRYRLTPIETREGSVIKREWCLEPDKTYTLAILDFGGPLPPGPDGKVEYFSAFHFYFTDPIPKDQLAREETIVRVDKPPPPPPPSSWPETPGQIIIVVGFMVVLVALLALRYFRRRCKK